MLSAKCQISHRIVPPFNAFQAVNWCPFWTLTLSIESKIPDQLFATSEFRAQVLSRPLCNCTRLTPLPYLHIPTPLKEQLKSNSFCSYWVAASVAALLHLFVWILFHFPATQAILIATRAALARLTVMGSLFTVPPWSQAPFASIVDANNPPFTEF